MLFIYMLYKVVLTFESVDEILINRDHLNYLSSFFLIDVYYAVQGGSK